MITEVINIINLHPGINPVMKLSRRGKDFQIKDLSRCFLKVVRRIWGIQLSPDRGEVKCLIASVTELKSANVFGHKTSLETEKLERSVSLDGSGEFNWKAYKELKREKRSGDYGRVSSVCNKEQIYYRLFWGRLNRKCIVALRIN